MDETSAILTAVGGLASTVLTIAGGGAAYLFSQMRTRTKELEKEVESAELQRDQARETGEKWRAQLWKAGIEPDPSTWPWM